MMKIRLGSSKKFDNIIGVEVKPSTEQTSAYYDSPYPGAPNELRYHEDHRPVVDVTVHYKNGTQKSQKAVGDDPYYFRKDKAQIKAKQAAKEAAKHLRSQGLVVFDGGECPPTKAAWATAPRSNDGGRGTTIFVICIALVVIGMCAYMVLF